MNRIEERINKFKDRSMGIIQLEEQREKIKKINSLEDLRYNIRMSNIV